ncbi:MAG: histidinol-phosphatase [Alphaproteobacteria bacterium]|nr:histidinol-phosphatase [Alphaproteobacteria bacterium]
MDRSALVALAVHLAEVARPIILAHYRTALAVEAKGDASPVTIADRGAEAAMRTLLEAMVPDHGILGEEYGTVRADARYVWVLDPIDGTKAFITGKPLFGTLIACCEDGVPVVGVIDMPALAERWVGADDRPATLNGSVVRTRACDSLAGALLNATSPDMFKGEDATCFQRLAQAVRHPLYGADCYGYAMTAAGWNDLVVEASLQPYDYCAPAAVLAAAGGVMTDWQGRPITLASGPRVIAAGDPRLIAPVVATLGGA